MTKKPSLKGWAAILLGTAGLAVMPQANAQDAAESAVIMSGTAQTGGAQRSLGQSISNSVGRAANAVGPRPANRQAARSRAQSRAAQGRASGGSIPAGVDPLANTDAASYALDNGATIKVSGRLNPSAAAHCTRNCPSPPQ